MLSKDVDWTKVAWDKAQLWTHVEPSEFIRGTPQVGIMMTLVFKRCSVWTLAKGTAILTEVLVVSLTPGKFQHSTSLGPWVPPCKSFLSHHSLLYSLGTEHTTHKRWGRFSAVHEFIDMLIMNYVVGECPMDQNVSCPSSSQADRPLAVMSGCMKTVIVQAVPLCSTLYSVVSVDCSVTSALLYSTNFMVNLLHWFTVT